MTGDELHRRRECVDRILQASLGSGARRARTSTSALSLRIPVGFAALVSHDQFHQRRLPCRA